MTLTQLAGTGQVPLRHVWAADKQTISRSRRLDGWLGRPGKTHLPQAVWWGVSPVWAEHVLLVVGLGTLHVWRGIYRVFACRVYSNEVQVNKCAKRNDVSL